MDRTTRRTCEKDNIRFQDSKTMPLLTDFIYNGPSKSKPANWKLQQKLILKSGKTAMRLSLSLDEA